MEKAKIYFDLNKDPLVECGILLTGISWKKLLIIGNVRQK